MTPTMPPLIKTNRKLEAKDIEVLYSTFKLPIPTFQPLIQHHLPQISLSDQKLHQDMDSQIQKVQHIQQALWMEKRKLEVLLREWHSRNAQRRKKNIMNIF